MTEAPGAKTAGATPSREERWANPRPLPAVRAVRITLRTAHLMAFGALYGGQVYGIPAGRLGPALLATVASGVAFMGLEIYRTPLWLVQVRGLATLAKMALLAAPVLWRGGEVWLLTAALVIGAVVSHMPGRFRYHSIVHGRPIGEQESG